MKQLQKRGEKKLCLSWKLRTGSHTLVKRWVSRVASRTAGWEQKHAVKELVSVAAKMRSLLSILYVY